MRNKKHKSKVKTRDQRVTDKNYATRMDCMLPKDQATEDSIIITNVLMLMGLVLAPIIVVGVGLKALINLYMGV